MRLCTIVAAITLAALSCPSTTLAAGPQCAPVSGLSEAIAKPDLRHMVFGEVHGTVQTPALIGDVACQISQARPVVLVLELPVQIQNDVNDWMGSDGGLSARAALTVSRFWTQRSRMADQAKPS